MANGAISRAEFMAQQAARFAKVDANGDGQITRDEQRAERSALRGARGPGKRGKGAGYAAPAGPAGGPLAGMERMGRGGRGGGGAAMLARLDTNGDGRISRAEYDVMTARQYERVGPLAGHRPCRLRQTGRRPVRTDGQQP